MVSYRRPLESDAIEGSPPYGPTFASWYPGEEVGRAQLGEQRGEFAPAADFYGQVVERFPESTEALARLAVARFRAGQLPEAARVLDRLRGRKTSRKTAADVNQVIQALNARRLPDGEE